ncbi:hypothetical protein FOCC_FOCC015888 [Frankliniella occidentalis]|nr:hypothetical protein FOCC_FOCC015888 [Frankliniella occidentalis]
MTLSGHRRLENDISMRYDPAYVFWTHFRLQDFTQHQSYSDSGPSIRLQLLQIRLTRFFRTGVEVHLHILRAQRKQWLSGWVLTAPIRFKDLFQHSGQPYVNNYIEAWPVLSHKAGHELILEDFKLLYPAAENLLYDRWEKFVQTTVALAKVDVKDKSCKKLLHMLNSSLSQSNQASVILHILPAIRPAHTLLFTEKTVKVTMDDARDSYLLQVKVLEIEFIASCNQCYD